VSPSRPKAAIGLSVGKNVVALDIASCGRGCWSSKHLPLEKRSAYLDGTLGYDFISASGPVEKIALRERLRRMLQLR